MAARKTVETKPELPSVETVRSMSSQLFNQLRKTLWEAPSRFPSFEEREARYGPALEQLKKDVAAEEKFRRDNGYYPWQWRGKRKGNERVGLAAAQVSAEAAARDDEAKNRILKAKRKAKTEAAEG